MESRVDVNAQKIMDEMAKEMGLKQLENSSDGNCLFESLSQLVYGNTAGHALIRKKIVQHRRKQ